MAKILGKFGVFVTGTVLGLALTGVNSAQAASLNFSLSFFNSTDSLVGEGSFSYDDSTPYEKIIAASFGLPPLEIKATNQWFALTSFSASVLGSSWNLSQASMDRSELLSPLLWAPLDPIKTRVVYDAYFLGSGIIPQLADQWIFGNIRTLPALAIFGSGLGAGGNRMAWLQSNNYYPGSGSGYVIAEQLVNPGENSEAVPEPATIAGLTLAAAGLGAAKKRFAAPKS
ncbi:MULTISPECIES: PEP-CTERM sorting domain-containing protein [unclassified Microcoleus]|uniref:PEP-CTERM sorting domain-containing protein n=1 Tax=unclassified Microcoleus TaxID=2642155 RepID=UPI002FCF0DBC